MKTMFATLVAITLLGPAAALAQSSTTGSTTSTTPASGPVTTTSTVPRDDGYHFPWGILGLFGLLGLYPLFVDRNKITTSTGHTPGKKI